MNIHIKFLIVIALGFVAGFVVHSSYFGNLPAQFRGQIIREGINKHINPILGCEIANPNSFSELGSVKKAVEAEVNRKINDQGAQKVSVYLRALNSGRWFGVNEDEKYSPASMFKILVMIAYLKRAETDSLLLEKKIKYAITPEEAKTPKSFRLEANEKYSIWEIVKNMIMDSSNVSLRILHENIDSVLIDDVFQDLNIDSLGAKKDKEEDIETMSPHTYSLVFRTLYGASYLSRDMSEKALDLLAKTSFIGGLTKGVPPEIEIAHKYGTRINSDSEELHDCGIVYYPEHPYLICIMTQGKSIKDLSFVISNLSGVIYKEMSKFYAQN